MTGFAREDLSESEFEGPQHCLKVFWCVALLGSWVEGVLRGIEGHCSNLEFRGVRAASRVEVEPYLKRQAT